MKKYKERIPFGSETRMVQPDRKGCIECNSESGSVHDAGCSAEECPECAKALIGCCCQCLSPYEAEKIIQALYGQFSDLESALNSAGEERCSAEDGSSYLQHAGMKYIFHHVPDSARSEITRAFHLRFPGLIPQLQDDNGRGYYTAEQLSEALDMPLHEVYERIEAMIASGQPIEFPTGGKLRKVH